MGGRAGSPESVEGGTGKGEREGQDRGWKDNEMERRRRERGRKEEDFTVAIAVCGI